jgi:hypothetical protein
MKITQNDKTTLRELAKRYIEIAAMPANAERRNRGRDINDLKPRRPMVWQHEIPWHEMDIDGKLALTCEDEAARGMEWHFRSSLFRWEYFQADAVMDDAFYIPKNYSSTGIGIDVLENTVVTDNKNYIISHAYIDQLDTTEKVAALREPVLTAFPEEDAKRKTWAEEILDGILPVRLRGYIIYHAPWDNIPRFRNVEAVMMDLVDNPELMHATIKKFSDAGLSTMKQMEKLGLTDRDVYDVHCTPPYISGKEPESGACKLKNIWFRGMAQMFGDISPAMWEEFDLQYMKPLMAECAYTYYGCCEALDRKIPMLKTIPNLRKIGVSPWANPESCAAQIGGGYVYAHKPNPAFVSGTFDPAPVRREIERVVKTCLEHKCPYEFVLKDISTVTYKPGNLIEWTKTVMGVIDEYYA